MNTTVEKNMSADLITINADDTLSRAHERMGACNIRHLPVRDEKGFVVGILSDRDVKRAMHSRHHKYSGMSDKTAEFDAKARVQDYMSQPVRSFDVKAQLNDVAELMINEKMSSILVTEYGRPIGILTTEDMLRVLLKFLAGHEGEQNLRSFLTADFWATA